MAFMDTPDFRTHKEGWECFLPDLKPGYNPIRMHRWSCEKGFKRCLKKACWRESGS
jgi:hypothetical protein